jgi:glyoxylate/hydroxypyruvate reductase A
MDLLFGIPGDDTAEWQAAIARHLPDATVHRAPARVACDYALVWKPAPEAFAGQSRLKAVFNLGAGVDAIVGMPGLPSAVPLIRLEDAGMAAQMVEYAVWGTLNHFRGFGAYAAQARDGLWKPRPARRPDSLTVGVLGIGVLGRAVLEGLRPFGFRLAGWSRTEKSIPGVATFAGGPALTEFLPLTPQTRGLLDAAALAALPRGAFVINVARGDIVVEDDLLGALDAKYLSGALLDVFHQEPLPPEHPFWRHPRVIVTPHVSAATLVDESVAQVAAKIRRLERGEPVCGIVDRVRAY